MVDQPVSYAESNATVEEFLEQHVNSPQEDLATLIRSVGRDATKYYLARKLALETLRTASVADLVDVIKANPGREQIVSDLSKIRTYSRGVNQETYLDLARDAGLSFDFGVPLKHLVVDFILHDPVAAEEAFTLSEARWQTGYQEFLGKEPPHAISFNNSVETELKEALRTLIADTDPGRKCVVNIKRSPSEVLMAAYIQQRRKEYYTISDSERVVVEVVTPAARTSASYDMVRNRLKIKAGPSKKLQRYISEAFGKAMYGDNNFFSDPERPSIYNLTPLKETAFRLELDMALPEVLAARVTEETLRFTVGEQQVLVTYQAEDVELLFPALSNNLVDLNQQERVSATIELEVLEGERSKIIAIRVIRGNKVEFDPRYAKYVHHFLQKWGLEIEG